MTSNDSGPSSVPPAAQVARQGGRAELAAALRDERAQLLALWRDYARALGPAKFEVRYLPELNPPLWELGHVAWFEEWWIARNPQRLAGCAAEPEVARAAALLPGADELYHSSRVTHTRRWHLALPDERRSLAYAERSRERTLALLAAAPETDDGLYFFRLALHHEAMHREAWVYMAQTLGIALTNAPAPAPATAEGEWTIAAHTHRLGHEGPGFAFDNELGAHDVTLEAFTIDRAPVSWARFLPFVEAGGYDQREHWSDAGWAWRQQHGKARPLHLRAGDDELPGWHVARFGQWQPIDPAAPALHLTLHEAQAWCHWAGRRLPTEAEWEAAAVRAAAEGESFDWGSVWEWTASAFAPYPGFTPHPYRDYSQPWFDGRPVLRGASFATSARLRHPRYRNYFPAHRHDIFAGFRSCAA